MRTEMGEAATSPHPNVVGFAFLRRPDFRRSANVVIFPVLIFSMFNTKFSINTFAGKLLNALARERDSIR
jgi:hypothetical protein